MKILGIDPGFKGAIVELDSESHKGRFLNLPYRTDKVLEFDKIKSAFDFRSIDMIFLEMVQGRTIWGADKIFTFGCNYGQILGFLYDKPHNLVSCKTWQKIAHFGCRLEDPKDKSREAFDRLNPKAQIKKSYDGMVDAFHIARYGLFIYHVTFHDNWEFEQL